MPSTAEGRYRRLFEPVDRGELALPEEVLTARATVQRLNTALRALTPPVEAQVPRDAAIRAALESPDPMIVDVSGILDHERHVAEFNQRRQILTRALEIADAELTGVLEDFADEIVTDFVRPTGQRLWAEITKQVKCLDGIDPITTDAMLRAPDRARRAYLELDALAGQYARSREAWSPLPEGQQTEHDTQGDHAEFRAGLCTVMGPNWRGSPTAPNRPKPPWRDDPRGRLIWLVRNEHIPWWPTGADRDAAWMETHREQYERMQNQNRLNQQTHGMWSNVG